MKKRLTIPVLAMILTMVLLLTAVCPADQRNEATATARMSLRIEGGPLSIDATDMDFGTIDLNRGNNQAVARNEITVTDPTGTKAGWNVSASASDLVSENGHRLSPEEYQLVIENLTAHSSRGGELQNPGRIQLSNEEQKICYATPNNGLGHNTINPTYRISVPENAPTGNYTGTISYTLVQGP